VNKLFPILGLAAGGLLLLGSKKNANASTVQTGTGPGQKPPGASTANPTEKQRKRAEWLSAIAHAQTEESYEQYVKVLNEAVKAGAITTKEALALQKKHPKFPKANSGSSNTAKSKSDLDKRIATALATNNPEVIRALADELERTSPDVPKDTIAKLRQAADDIDRALKSGQESAPPVLPPVAPPPVSVARPKRPAAKPKPTDQTYDPVAHAPAGNSREIAIDLAKHLTGRKKGTEDKALIEKYQRNENRIRVANDQNVGLQPDGLYGLETAMSLSRFDLVPPKPLYWGKGGTYASMMAEKKQWKDWCLSKAQQDPARSAEWIGASKV
jgi:hypothetical protein